MVTETKGIFTKPAAVAFGVLMLIGGVALGAAAAGWKARGEMEGLKPPLVLTSGFSNPDPAVTAEQVRQLSAAIAGLQVSLSETIKQVNELNARLGRVEGFQSAQK